MVVEGGRGPAGMEHGRMVLEKVLEGLQVARVSLRRKEEGGREEGWIGREGGREKTGKEGGGRGGEEACRATIKNCMYVHASRPCMS